MNCPGCELPMINGQAFNDLLKCHWDCQDIVRKNMGDQNADDLIQFRINKRLAMDGITPEHRLFEKAWRESIVKIEQKDQVND